MEARCDVWWGFVRLHPKPVNWAKGFKDPSFQNETKNGPKPQNSTIAIVQREMLLRQDLGQLCSEKEKATKETF